MVSDAARGAGEGLDRPHDALRRRGPETTNARAFLARETRQ
jgi:hypothetical protein